MRDWSSDVCAPESPAELRLGRQEARCAAAADLSLARAGVHPGQIHASRLHLPGIDPRCGAEYEETLSNFRTGFPADWTRAVRGVLGYSCTLRPLRSVFAPAAVARHAPAQLAEQAASASLEATQ